MGVELHRSSDWQHLEDSGYVHDQPMLESLRSSWGPVHLVKILVGPLNLHAALAGSPHRPVTNRIKHSRTDDAVTGIVASLARLPDAPPTATIKNSRHRHAAARGHWPPIVRGGAWMFSDAH